MGKWEIACYEQFLHFPQCFQKACFPGASKGIIVWEWVMVITNNFSLDIQKLLFLSSDFSPLTSDTFKKSSQWLC